MLNPTDLKTRTVKDLAALAKKKGIPGWHGMRKDQLVRALLRLAKREAAQSQKRAKATPLGRQTPASAVKSVGTNGHQGNGHAAPANGKAHAESNGHMATAARNGCQPPVSKARRQRIERRLCDMKEKIAQSHDLAHRNGDSDGGKDRVVIMVRDPHWLQAYWELTRQNVNRARAAMGQHWHGSKPILRLYEVGGEGTATSARHLVRDIEIHGGVNHWYIDVHNPPRSFQVDVGYLALSGRFFSLARSNIVTTPQVGVAEVLDGNWSDVADDCDRIYALSGGNDNMCDSDELRAVLEERLRRPMGPPLATRFGLGAPHHQVDFPFEINAELVVFGGTEPGAQLTLKGEPVRVQADGSFAVRFNLPDRRQVLPIVASSADGTQQRTIVLAVERNTKIMEPVLREAGE